MDSVPATPQSGQEESYRVQLPVFEGPLDLLLHLIKKSEINIYDIPIAVITQQYLGYLDLMKSLNLNIAGEFLVMAATLIHIKSRMLLPPEPSEEEEVLEDPRRDLIYRLLEYQRYKDAADRLGFREDVWREVFRREADPEVDAECDEVWLSDVSLFDLMGALQSVLARTPKKEIMEIVPDELSVRKRMSLVMERLEGAGPVPFEELFDQDGTKPAVIVTFLAILELVRLQLIVVQQNKPFGAIRILKSEDR